MQIIADLHIHSKYSRAVSQKMDLVEIAAWAGKKGIQLVTTGDFTHPVWFKEIKNNLKEINPGIYSLNVRAHHDAPLQNIKFILTTEISSIYSHAGQTRRIHNLVFAPNIETAEKINKEFLSRGTNLMADGRPITGIPSHELLEMILTINKDCFLIPCHVWTPWFSIFGSKSGYDSIKTCFGNWGKYIYAVETGLSSDPIMNWQIKELENRSIVSFSDAHSAPKLGREATVFISTHNSLPASPAGGQTTNFSYLDVIDAFKQKPNSKMKIGYTIEFFPEEGKYHWSGHRACNTRYTPKEVKEKGVICPVCRKPLTIGVENRVWDLSSKTLGEKDLLYIKNNKGITFVYDKEKKRRPFVSLIPFLEILTEVNGGSPVKAQREYENMTSNFGTEFDILLKKTYEEIEKFGGEKLAQAIRIVRERKVFVDPGYDGVFGQVKIINNHERTITNTETKTEEEKDQLQLF